LVIGTVVSVFALPRQWFVAFVHRKSLALAAVTIAVAAGATSSVAASAGSAPSPTDRAGVIGSQWASNHAAGAKPRVLLLGDSTMAASVWYDGQGVTKSADILRERFDIDLDAESCRRIARRSCNGFDRITNQRYVPLNVVDEMRLRRGQQFDALVVMAGYDEFNLGSAIDAVMSEARSMGIARVVWLNYRTTTAYTLPGGVNAAGLYERLNVELAQASQRYSDLSIIDWDGHTKSQCNQPRNPGSTLPGTGTSVATQCWFWWDGIHMTPDGAIGLMTFLRDQLPALVGQCASSTIEPPLSGSGPRPDAPGAGFVAVAPIRVIDTAKGDPIANTPVAVGAVTRASIASITPAGATAAVLSLSAVAPCQGGFLVAFACGEGSPQSSSLNTEAGGLRTTVTIVRIDANGELCVRSSMVTHVVADVIGWFVPGEDRYSSTTPQRIVDTRSTTTGVGTVTSRRAPGQVTEVVVPGVAASASSVWVNVVGVDPRGAGAISVHRCGDTPVAVLQLDQRRIDALVVGGAALVGVSGGKFCVTTDIETDLVIDVFGSFDRSGPESFVATSPVRVVDTRTVFPVLPNQPLAWTVKGSADVVTATSVRSNGTGYLSAAACGTSAPISNINVVGGDIVPVLLASAADAAAQACLTTSTATHAIIDRLGYFTRA
jgi:hypothetical protein